MNLESKLFIQLNMYCTSTVEAVMKNITMIIPYMNTRTLAIKIESIINKYFINQRLSQIKYTYHSFKTDIGNETIVYVNMREKDLLNDYKTLQRIKEDYVLCNIKSEIEACLTLF